ncbi:Glycerol dehydrogenase [Corynebacterium pseudotuberculosis]|nr:Glycerol dehydrogenase [Corynebacterium pseudotuberculosis]AUY56106.1 Glycerol dehydrogenase [Corynebacterium pseudotuberculosis]AZN19793.1 Glycerol dehydrogenase [Corynebacterium pseudotuberculosis]AZN21892.1 Glycerol dehydrogenase [Corynebacterium pseudotuberculosis]QBB90933.1 Glycerol dehydrogenase [Corynebacterium pseudotuberculosis]
MDLSESDVPAIMERVPTTTEWKVGEYDFGRFARAIIDAQVFN